MQNIIKLLFKKSKPQVTEPNAAHAGIIDLYHLAVEQFSGTQVKVSPLTYAFKRSFFGSYQDETAAFYVDEINKTTDTIRISTAFNVIYSAKQGAVTITTAECIFFAGGCHSEPDCIRSQTTENARDFIKKFAPPQP